MKFFDQLAFVHLTLAILNFKVKVFRVCNANISEIIDRASIIIAIKLEVLHLGLITISTFDLGPFYGSISRLLQISTANISELLTDRTIWEKITTNAMTLSHA